MDRRVALSISGLICGGVFIGAGSILTNCQPKERKSILGLLNKEEIKVLEEIAETILPKTEGAPGVKEIEIGKYINSIVTDCFDNDEQQVVIQGVKQLNEFCNLTFEDDFIDLGIDAKHKALLVLEAEAKAHNLKPENRRRKHYYSMIKDLTIQGYTTSEKVGTEVFNHVPIPGRFDGCIPYLEGQKAFS